MKKIKVLSLLLSVLLLASCVLGVLILGAGAKEATVIYTACDYTEEGKEHFIDITTALANAAKESGQWKKDDALEIRFSGTQSGAGAQDGLLFAQKTIWREDGTKLPITIRGIDTKKSRDALIDLDHAGGWYACANDYTFVNLTMPIGTWGVTFYAGSGNVKFEECHLATTSSRIMVPDASSQKQLIRLSKEVSDRICSLYNVGMIPAGDAWAEVVNDPSSPFHSTEYGHVLRAMASKGTLYGDWTHDGDVGGGQYLNACIVFEVVTHMSCLNIDWEPSYGLVNPNMSFKALRELAHRAVVNYYGEDYFNASFTDIGNDGEFNILFPGSSTCYYFADELASLGYHAGLDMNVYNPYISSLKINPQWEKINTAAEEYQLRVWKDTGSGAKLTTTAKQSLQNIMPLKTWDACFVYTGASQFDDYGLKESDYPANINKIMPDMAGAEGTYAFLRENLPEGAGLFWYQPPVAPIGAFGTSTGELNGYIYADTCTDAVFAGWPELKAGEKVKTSITFGNNVVYEDTSTAESRAAILVAASGYHPDEAYSKLDAASAKEVKFMESGLEDIPDIRPVDTEVTFYIDGENAKVYNVAAKVGSSPCAATVHLKKGGVQRIGCDNYTVQSTDNGLDGKEEYFYGDLGIIVNGGTVAGSVNTTWDSTVVGNVNLHIEKTGKENINILGNVSGNMGNNTVGRYTGDSTTYIKGANIVGEVKLGGSNQANVYNTIEDCTIGGIFIGSMNNQPVTVTNTLRNTSFGGTADFYLGTNGDACTNVVNTIENCSFAGNVYGGNKSGYVRGSITNTIKNSTFEKNFYGGNRLSSIAGSVTNTITGGSVIGTYYGGTASSSTRTDTIGGQIKNTIDGTSFSATYLYCGSSYASFAEGDAYDFRIENEISNVTASNTRFIGSCENKAVDTVKNTFAGENEFKYTYCASSASNVTSITNYFKGKITGGMVVGGGNNATVENVTNYIEDGADLINIYAAGNNYGATLVRNFISGGKVEAFYGGSRAAEVASVTNTVTGGVIGDFYGGGNTASSAVSGTVTNLIQGGDFTNFYGGGNAGSASAVNTTISGGAFRNSITKGGNTGAVTTATLEFRLGQAPIRFYGTFTLENLTGSGVIQVGKNASVTVSGGTAGNVAVEQVEYWQDQTYFTDSTEKITLSVIDDAPGTASVSGHTVVGVAPSEKLATPVAARLVLDTRVGIKFYFNKSDVSESFSYTVVMGEKELASGEYKDLTEEGEYLVLSFGGIGLSDFMTEFSIESEAIYDESAENHNTVVELAELGAANCEKYREKQMFYAIADLGRCAKDPASVQHNLAYRDIVSASSGQIGEDGALLSFTGKNLLMSDAIGLRLYSRAQSAEAVDGMKVIFDGKDVTAMCDISEAVLGTDGYEFTVDVFFSVSKMQNRFDIQILDENGKRCLTLSDQVDWVAQMIINKEPDNALAKQILIYIQKTNDYINPTIHPIAPSTPGGEAEIGGKVEL